MKKILISVLIVLLILFCYNVVFNGYQIGNSKILGINEIKTKNEELDQNISNVQELKETVYPKEISVLVENANQLKSTKKEYEELVAYSSEQDVLRASQEEKYDVEVLWVRIGNHAEKRKVIPKLEVLSSSNNTTGANDLRITATGRYIGLSDFVRDIEDDAKLGFTIENFELVPVAGENGTELQATFKIKDVFLNPDTMSSVSVNNSQREAQPETKAETQSNTGTTRQTDTESEMQDELNENQNND